MVRETFFQPTLLSDLINGLTEGLFSQNGQAFDNQFATDITNHLYVDDPEKPGLDLLALNVQRGRDHGLPGMDHGQYHTKRTYSTQKCTRKVV